MKAISNAPSVPGAGPSLSLSVKPALAEHLLDARADILAFTTFPKQVPNREAVIRLVGLTNHGGVLSGAGIVRLGALIRVSEECR